MLKVLYGNEPFRIEQCKKSVQKNLANPEFNCSILYGSYDSSVDDLVNTVPFLSDKRVVILTVNTLKELDNELFLHLLNNPLSTTICLIIVRTFDNRLKLAKLLKANGLLYPCDKYNESELQSVIVSSCAQQGARITLDAISSLIKRTAYLDFTEITFLDVNDWITKLASVTKEITLSVIEENVPQKEQPNAFLLATLIKDKQYKKLQHEINLFTDTSGDEIINSLSALLWQYRISYKAKMFPLKEIGVRSTILDTLSEQTLVRGIAILNSVIAKIKQGTIPTQIALKYAISFLIEDGMI